MTTLDQAISQMLAAGMPGFPPGHPQVNAGRIIRYGPKKKAWYRLHDFRAASGAYVVTGAYGMWGELEPQKIEVDWKGINAEERERMQHERAQAEAREAAKILKLAKFAAGRARKQWHEARSGRPSGVAQTYLDRKGVEHEKGLRYLADGTLLVPMIRYDVTEAQEAAPDYAGPWRLCGLQKIAPDGAKRFNKGMAKVGAAFRLGKAPSRGDLILVAEGVATALSLRMATERQFTVYTAFDAGNLLPAVKILRGLYPENPLLICADDDAYLVASMNRLLRENHGMKDIVTPPITGMRFAVGADEIEVNADWVDDAHGVRGIVGAVLKAGRTFTFSRENAGRVYAHRAALEVGNCTVIYPVFADRPLLPDPDAPVSKLTDFNDLHAVQGIKAVAAQLDAEIKRAAFSREVAKVVNIEVARIKKSAKAEKKKELPPSFDFDGFSRRFTLIYPTDTVYDAQLEVICKIPYVKINFGEGVVNWWLRSPDRRTVNADQVVFDPAGNADPKTTINLFRGLAAPAARGEGASCERLLGLLQYLCAEEGQDVAPVTDWVLRWLAYPLQHVGAKMATALVMHGPAEGTGKNLFFNAVRDIYGRYGSLITQTQLESPYNGWMSQRLFVIANEVISRQELRHHVGRLKNLVTESPLPIEEKYLPMRYEDNHMNMVFLTNEFQALQISMSDRRYMVIRTPAVNTEAFYAAVLAELANGGGAALHHYLLNLDLGDFNEHTKPIMTAAKEDLIEMGLTSVQQFWRELHDGLLYPLEYGPALWRDLYEVYKTWCVRNGVKNPRPSNQFGQEFKGMNGVRQVTQRIADPDKPGEWAMPAEKRPQRSVYLMGSMPDDIEADKWRDEGCKRFRLAWREYASDGVSWRRSQGADADGKD